MKRFKSASLSVVFGLPFCLSAALAGSTSWAAGSAKYDWRFAAQGLICAQVDDDGGIIQALPDFSACLDVDPEAGVGKAVTQAIAQLNGDKPTKKIDPSMVSPSFTANGLGGGALIGGAASTGLRAGANAGAYLRGYGDGTWGPQDIQAVSPTDLENSLKTAAAQIAHHKALEFSKNNSGMSQADVDRYEISQQQKYAQAFASNAQQYLDAFEHKKAVEASKPGGRPLFFYEGDAAYNMVGVNGNNAYTGVSGRISAGVGGQSKAYGKNGCGVYGALTGNLATEAYWNLESADSRRMEVGFEQGPICQVAHSVTFMASPSVQVGEYSHAAANGNYNNMQSADWLTFAGKARMIVDDKFYLSAGGIYHPKMGGDTGQNAHWNATEVNLSADLKVSPDFAIGIDAKASKMHDTNAASSNPDITDSYAGVRGYYVF